MSPETSPVHFGWSTGIVFVQDRLAKSYPTGPLYESPSSHWVSFLASIYISQGSSEVDTSDDPQRMHIKNTQTQEHSGTHNTILSLRKQYTLEPCLSLPGGARSPKDAFSAGLFCFHAKSLCSYWAFVHYALLRHACKTAGC